MEERSLREALERLRALAPHLSVVHHTPGRVRLRVHPRGFGAAKALLQEQSLPHLPGITTIRVNTLARSVVLEYDQEILHPGIWTALGALGAESEDWSEVALRLLASAPKAPQAGEEPPPKAPDTGNDQGRVRNPKDQGRMSNPKDQGRVSNPAASTDSQGRSSSGRPTCP